MFTVLWLQAAIDELTRIYTHAFETGGDTAGITRATDRIDRVLQSNPTEVGESREDYQRVEVVEPLTFLFEVLVDERIVVILRVIYHSRR